MGPKGDRTGEDRTGDRGGRRCLSTPPNVYLQVLFLDIVEYSQRSVAEQIALKERFNKVLTEAITGVPTTIASSSTPATAQR